MQSLTPHSAAKVARIYHVVSIKFTRSKKILSVLSKVFIDSIKNVCQLITESGKVTKIIKIKEALIDMRFGFEIVFLI